MTDAQDDNPFEPTHIDLPEVRPKQHAGDQLWHIFGCLALYFSCTYSFGTMGANLPPNLGLYLAVLPAIPTIVVFHVVGAS